MTSVGGRVEGTRERILAILRRRSEGIGINDLAEEIGLAGATVRRHLDVLLRDGYVAIQQVKGRTGRPRYVFSITAAGADLFPHHYVRLTHRLLDEIMSLDAGETHGRDGRALAGLVFERMAERLAVEYASKLRGGALRERTQRAASLLAEEGIDFEVVPGSAGSVEVVGRGCPCQRIASGTNGASSAGTAVPGCEHDRQLLERLLGVRAISLTPAELPGDSLCGYRLTSMEAAPSAPLVPLA